MKKLIYLFLFSILLAASACSSSKSSGKNSDPLVIVNGNVLEGFEWHDFNFKKAGAEEYAELLNISPDLIEKIEVLKKSSDCAKYGERGANGVVLITTMRKVIPPPPPAEKLTLISLDDSLERRAKYYEALEIYYSDVIKETGFTPEIREAILRTMKDAPDSKVYNDALISSYADNPLYGNLLIIARNAYKNKNYIRAREFYTKLNTEHKLEIFESEKIKFETLSRIADSYFKEKGGKYNTLKPGEILAYIGFNLDVIDAFPDDFHAYMNIAFCFIYNSSIQAKGYIAKYLRGYYAYDWITKAQAKFNANKANSKYSQEQIDKIDELINNLVSTAYSMLPDKIVAFQTGGKYDNTSATYLKVRGKPFPTTIRFQKY